MVSFYKLLENNYTYFMIPLNVKINDRFILMDATDILMQAQKTDRKNGYHPNGPMFGIEIKRAREYADYVATHINAENMDGFDTKHYSFCPTLMTSEQLETIRVKDKSV